MRPAQATTISQRLRQLELELLQPAKSVYENPSSTLERSRAKVGEWHAPCSSERGMFGSGWQAGPETGWRARGTCTLYAERREDTCPSRKSREDISVSVCCLGSENKFSIRSINKDIRSYFRFHSDSLTSSDRSIFFTLLFAAVSVCEN